MPKMKLLYWIKKNYLFILPFVVLAIFVFTIWDGNFFIGGDDVLPLNPSNNIYRSLYIWDEENLGVTVWRYMHFVWKMPFYIFSLLGIAPLINIKIYFSLLLMIGFLFTYLFYRALFKNSKYNKKNLAIFCGFIFILSASQVRILQGTNYLAALPLCSYLVVKYLDTKKFWFIILFSIAVNDAYLAQLPQAKFLFIFLACLFFILLIYKQLRNISFKKLILKLLVLSVFTFLLNAFILVPFLLDAITNNSTYTYGYLLQNIFVYNGNADLNSAALPYISRFFDSNLINDVSFPGRFLGSSYFALWTFTLWIIAFLPLFFVKKSEKKTVYLLFIGLIFFIFLAKGSNPPFGEVYKFLLFNLPLFKIFRTTSILVIGGTLLFAVLVTISIYYLEKKWKKILFLVLIIHVIVFHPIYLGYRLITFVEKGRIIRGFSIPKEYYEMGNKLDIINDDLKILSLPLDEGYSYKDWSYMGSSIMYWITRKPFIHGLIAGYSGFTDNTILQRMTTRESCFWTGINNIGYILNEKDSRIPYSLANYNYSISSVFEDSYFKLDKVKSECTLPHIYAANDVYFFQGQKNSIPGITRFIKNSKDIVISLDSNTDRIKDISNIVLETYPDEINDLKISNQDKKVSKDIPGVLPFSSWTYAFNVPIAGNYKMFVDKENNDDKTYTFSKGNNKIKFPVTKSKNLIDFDNTKFKGPTFGQALEGWEKDNIYLLTLEYKSDVSTALTITVEETQRNYNGRQPPNDSNAILLSKEINQKKPGIYKYQALIRSDINAQNAAVTLTQISGVSDIMSFEITKVTPPKIFFTNLKTEKKKIPKIVLHKINPTRYIVDVENASNPYSLIFSESFNTGWKAYITTCTSCNKFQEWSLTPVSENKHIIVNGFANAWNIGPQDSKGKTNYKVIIEYFPQRMLLIGAIISILTLILFFIYRVIKFILLRKH